MLQTLLPRQRRHRARALLSTCLLFGALSAAAQVSVYNFQNVSGTYAPLSSGATPFAINGGAGFDGDDAYSATLVLPFSFTYGGATANTVIVNSNGFLGLGGSANSTAFNVDMFPNAATFYDRTIAYAGVDLKNTATVYRWRVDGTAPNRIWKMEASNFDRFNGLGQTGSAQVWLYEGTNQIDIVYGTFSNLWDPAFLSFEVGLRGSGPSDLKTIGGTWAAPVASNSATTITTSQNSIPTPGQTFRFTVGAGTDLTPPTIGTVTLTPAVPSCTAAAHTVTVPVTDASGVASVTLRYAVNGGAQQTLPMTGSGGTYSATIPAQGSNLVTYTISAVDASAQANTATTTAASYADAPTAVSAGAAQTINTGQTATLTAAVPMASSLKITEVTFNGASAGATTPRPTYIPSADDDFVEISNTSAATLDLGGYRFEARSASGTAARNYTFPTGVTLPGKSVLLLHLGTGTDDATNRYYHTGGNNDAFFSGSDAGFILYSRTGGVVDAVALNGYAFTSTVTAADWSTPPSISSTSGTAGASLLGADQNNGSNWQVASNSVPQTLGTYNAGVPDAPLTPVTWTGGLLASPVTANPLTTPVHPNAGSFTYTASYTANGCTATSQVTVTVQNPVTPVANFAASTTTPSVGQTVTFTDLSTNLPGAWQWSFTPNTVTFVGGTSATSRNPQVTFDGAGCYSVTLTASNGAGADSETKTNYVCAALSYCTTNLQQNACASFTNWINTVSITGTTLNNVNTGCNSANGNSYVSWPASGATTAALVAGQTYTLSVTTNSVGTTAAWLDYNANGQLEASEFILVQASGPPNQAATTTFTIPATSPGGAVLLRIRNGGLSNSIAAGDACVLRFSGETEDYTVTLQPGCANPPTAGFSYPTAANGVCYAQGVTLTPQLTTGATAGSFTTNGPGLDLNATTGVISVASSQPGVYTIYNTVAASGACPAALDSTTIEIEEPLNYEVVTNDTTALCPGTSALLEVREIVSQGRTARRTITSYEWLRNGQPISGATSATYSATQAGTYAVVVTTAAGCVDTADAITITLLPAQSAAFNYGTNNIVCIDGITQLTPNITGTPGGTFLAPSLSIDPATGTIDLSNAPNGTYEVIYTTPGPCAATDTVLLTLTPLPIVAFTYPAATICAGGPDTLQVQIAPDATPGTYAASPAGLTIDAATGTVIGATSASGVYTITSTVAAGGGCSAVTGTFTLTVSPQASAAFSYGSGTFCLSGTNPTPNVTGTTGGTFSVAPAGLSLDATTGTIDLSASAAGTYTVTYTVAGACGATSTQAVTLTNAPSAAFSYPNVRNCAGTPGTLAPVLDAGAVAGTFSANSPDLSVDPVTGVIDIEASQPGIFWVYNTVAASGSCAAALDSAAVQLEASPRFAITPNGPTTVCAGDSVLLTARPLGSRSRPLGLPLLSFQWQLNGQPIVGAADSLYYATQSGIYSVTVTNDFGCAKTTDTVRVTVNPLQAANFSYGASTICLSATTNPAPVVTGTAGGTFSAAPAGLTLNAATGEIDLSASAAGTYTVTYTTPGPCAGQATATLTLTTAPTAAFSYPATSPCAGTSGTLTPSLATGASAGTFSASPAGLTIDATTGTIDIVTSAAGTYTVTNTLAPANGCAGAVDSTTFVIEALPVVGVSVSGPLTFCAGDSVTLTATGGGVFQWNSGQNTASITVRQSGDYVVTVLNAAGCSATSDTVSVVVTPRASAAFSYPTDSTCAGSIVPLVPTLGTGATAGTFSASPVGLTIDPATGVVNAGTSQAGTYTVTNTVTGTGGCSDATATTTVTILAAPAQPTFTATPQGSGIVILTSGSPTGNQWFLNGTPITGATAPTYTVTTAGQSGTYTLQVSNGPCASVLSDPQTITVTGTTAEVLGALTQLYPNPTLDGRVTVELAAATTDTHLTVFDAAGRAVFRTTLAAGTKQAQLDLHHLPTGVYAVKIGATVRRLVRD